MLNTLLGVGNSLFLVFHMFKQFDISFKNNNNNNFFLHLFSPMRRQNGVVSSIKPQQVTYIIPGVENFNHADIGGFIQKAQDNLVGLALTFVEIQVVFVLFRMVKLQNFSVNLFGAGSGVAGIRLG